MRVFNQKRRPSGGRLARALVCALAILSFSAGPAGETAWAETAAAEETSAEPASSASEETSAEPASSVSDGASVVPANAAYGYKNSPVAMEASYGYDNMAKGGRYLPVYVTLTNQLETSFSGSLVVKSMESDFDIYQYEYPVQLEGAETIQKNLNIPLGLRADQLHVQLYDEEGNQILKKRLKMNMRQDTPELLIGTLSDSQDKLEYLNEVGIRYSTLLTRTCAMVAGSIPEQVAGLDQLDVLLITNYDIRRLSVPQIETIKEWVSRGGILLLGTGARGQEAVETFLEEEVDEISEPEERVVNMGREFAIYGPSDVMLPLTTTEIIIRDGNVVLSNNGLPILTAVNWEKGMVAVAAYDFADIGSFCQEHSYIDKLFTNLLGEDRIQEIADYLYDGGSRNYWTVQSMINTGSVEKLPKISLYVIAISSYILLAGPGLYFFLKQRELQTHYGGFVVLLSLCCSGIIYLISGQTRFEDTFFNYASIRDYSEETIVETTYMNMRTPYNRPYSVRLEPSYDIRPLTRLTSYENSRFAKFTGDEAENIRIRYGEEASLLTVEDVAAFSPNYFRLEKRDENPETRGITGQVTCFDGKMSGSITNHLGRDVERGAVLCSGMMVLVDAFEDGETLVLDGAPVLYYPITSAYAAADRITGGYQFEKADITSPEYMKSLERSNLLAFYLDDFLTGYQHGARVVAFAAEKETDGFLLEDGYEVDGLTLYTSSLEAAYEKNGRISHISLEGQPKVINGTYSAKANTTDGMAPLTLEYSLGNDLEVEKITFLSPSEEFMENNRYGGLPFFDGEMYFYNYHTGKYDRMEDGQKEFIDWQLEPYLSSENQLTVKYAYDTPKDYMMDISLPVLSVVGREK
ncbi:MAG: hypothetical protein Q4F29_02580 [Lachnospiraceae bacterium]|nr:hypothetical protein [Lachnospiraceae bacterium]